MESRGTGLGFGLAAGGAGREEGAGMGGPAGVGLHRPAATLGNVERVADSTGEKLQEEFLAFLENYAEPGAQGTRTPTIASDMRGFSDSEPPQMTADIPLYRQQLHEMRNEGTNTLYIDYNHLFRYNDVLANAIAYNYYRFEPFLRAALQAFVAAHLPSYARLSSKSQSREFWISIYGLGVVHR